MATSGWAVGGGVPHSPEEARRLTYAATGGAEGVGSATDMRVLPLSVPGQGVRVVRGSCLIRSRYNAAETETYQGTVVSQETIATTPTGSGGRRSDLVVMMVEDPWANGSTWPKPSNPANANVFPIRVITGVPANTTRLQDVPGYQNHTAATLARIDFPASTGTVTSGMIKDLRVLPNPRRTEVVFARPRVSADDTIQRFLTASYSDGGEYFPGGGGAPNEFEVDVPPWATRMVIDARWMGVNYDSSKNPGGRYWIEYGNEFRNKTWPNKRQWEFATQEFLFGSIRGHINGDGMVTDWGLMDEVPVPAKLRGGTMTVVFKAGLEGTGIGNRAVFMNWGGGLGCRITFAERAVDADMV